MGFDDMLDLPEENERDARQNGKNGIKTGLDRDSHCVSSTRAGTPKDGTWNPAHPVPLTGECRRF